jgi:hypothetical protein
MNAQTRGTVLSRGAQADARGATQLFDLGGQPIDCSRRLFVTGS